MQPLIVRGAPQEYECRVGAWDTLEQHLTKRKLSKILLVHGTESWAAAKPYLPKLDSFTVHFEHYGGECTDERTAELAALIEQEKIEVVLAVGGGKVTDLSKASANQARKPVFILPTLAATCAAYTPLSVIYRPDGTMIRYDIFPQANTVVLIEPDVILHSPSELMIAGIGDTLAKWYEADAIISQLPVQPLEVQVAAFAAKKSRDVLLSDSYEALAAMENGTINQAFLNVLEANILLAGMVGGFGDSYGRTSGAHAIHDALTILPDSHQQLHGNKVAYSILVQLVIENKWSEIERLLPFYQQLALPISLNAMKLSLSEKDYQQVGRRATLPGETIHLMKETITPEVVITAMKQLENFARGLA